MDVHSKTGRMEKENLDNAEGDIFSTDLGSQGIP